MKYLALAKQTECQMNIGQWGGLDGNAFIKRPEVHDSTLISSRLGNQKHRA